MESITEARREILHDFLDHWPIDRVKLMTLNEYVSVGDKNTFCQWLETKTRQLGSIKGINSSKFGIYKRGNKLKKPKRLRNDNEYSWQKYYSEDDRNEAFKKIRKEILLIIHYSESGKFEQIDGLHLTQFVRWKIAYLYSNERLIPIFRKDVLVKIAKDFGLNATKKTPISEIQKIMIAHKPAHLSIYEYSKKLYDKFGREEVEKKKRKTSRKTKRKATTTKNIGPQTRKGASTYIATQRHNILQEALKKKLVEKYGDKNVLMEENFVDIKVVQPNKIYLYEVKSSAYASDCVREALGQILSYAHCDNDSRTKHLIVVGQYKPNEDEIEFIKYIKKNIKLGFEYEQVDID